MTQQQHNVFLQTPEQELIPTLGCAEPRAIAYAAAKARQVLGEIPRGHSPPVQRKHHQKRQGRGRAQRRRAAGR